MITRTIKSLATLLLLTATCSAATAAVRDAEYTRLKLPAIDQSSGLSQYPFAWRRFSAQWQDETDWYGSPLAWSDAIGVRSAGPDTHAEMEVLSRHPIDIEPGMESLEHHPELAEQFHVNASPVPLPAGALLLASGLAGMAGLRRHKNSK